MWYVIVGTDVDGSLERRQAVRPKHLARLRELEGEGRLLLAGPFPATDSEQPGADGFTGSLIVARFDNLGSAREWAAADPYVEAGVYDHVDVKPFIKALP